jgi:solute:Na+ symporter, SSS family
MDIFSHFHENRSFFCIHERFFFLSKKMSANFQVLRSILTSTKGFSMNLLGKLDMWLIVSYMMVLLFVGFVLILRNKTPKQFLTAGGQISANLIAFSVFGTYFSNIGFFGNVGKAFGKDTSYVVYALMVPVAALIGNHYFVKFYRSRGYISAFTHLTERFGRWATVYGSVAFTIYGLLRNSLITYLVGIVLYPLTGWDVKYIILGTGGIVLIYVYLGGIEAAIRTDFLQSILIFISAIVCIVYLFYRIPMSPGKAIEYAWTANKFSLGSFKFDLSTASFWTLLIYGLVGNVSNYAVDQGYVQRYLAAESEQAAKKGFFRGSLLISMGPALFCLIGVLLFVFYRTTQHSPDLIKAITGKPDSAFPTFILRELPAGLKGIMIVGVLAAAMSTISTYMQSLSTVFYENYYKPIMRKRSPRPVSDSEGLKVLHISSAVIGAAIVGLALAMSDIKSILDVYFQWASFIDGGMLGLFLLGFCFKYIKSYQAIIAISIGIVMMFLVNLPTLWPNSPINFHIHFLLNSPVGVATMLILGFFFNMWAKKNKTA